MTIRTTADRGQHCTIDGGTSRAGTILALPPVLKQNPYQRLLYSHLCAHGFTLARDAKLRVVWLWKHRGDVGVLHFHWPQAYYRFERGPLPARVVGSWVRLSLFMARLVAARLLRYRVVWTVHQVLPHDQRRELGDRAAAWFLGRWSNALVAHDEETRRAVRRLLGSVAAAKTTVIPHGSYVGVYPKTQLSEALRNKLQVPRDAFVFLYFGEVKAYKDIPILLDAIRLLDDREVAVIIAGPPRDPGIAQLVEAAAASDGRIRPHLEFIPDTDVGSLFAACDVAVLPRGDGGSSGALILSLSLGTPVVCADQPSYRELTAQGGAGWYFAPRNACSLAAAMMEAAGTSVDGLRERRHAALTQAALLDWKEIAARTAAILASDHGFGG